jgi:hypothetical protein
MGRNIHHRGTTDPRFVARLLNQPTRHDPDQKTGDATFGPKHRAVYNYLRRFGGWDGEHHGLTVGTIARAIGLSPVSCHTICLLLDHEGIVTLERKEAPSVTTEPESLERYAQGEHDLVKLANEEDWMKCRGTTIDADLADYVNRAIEGTDLSFRDAVNGLLEQAILADMREACVPKFEGPTDQFYPRCRTCKGSRHVIVHGEKGAEAVTCPDCEASHLDWVGTRYVDGVSGRNSSTPPVVNQLR